MWWLRPPTLVASIGWDADTPLTSHQHFLVAVEERVLAIEKERVLAIEKVRAAVERIDRGFSDEPVLIETKAARRARRRLRDGISLQWDSRVKPEPRRFDAAAVIHEVGRMIRDAGREPWFQTSDPDQNQVQTPNSGESGTAGVVYGVDLHIGKGQSASGGILSITLFGEGGDSDAHQLVKEWHGPPGTSVHTQQMFTIDCAAELGELTKLEIVHSSPGTAGARLFVQQVVILHPLLPDAHFVCDWWAAEEGVSRLEVYRNAPQSDILAPSSHPWPQPGRQAARRPRKASKRASLRASDTFFAFQEA
jgi:hypothetical protein